DLKVPATWCQPNFGRGPGENTALHEPPTFSDRFQVPHWSRPKKYPLGDECWLTNAAVSFGYALTATHASTVNSVVGWEAASSEAVTQVEWPSNRSAPPCTPSVHSGPNCDATGSSTLRASSWAAAPEASSKLHEASKFASGDRPT